jgi:CRP-like cAMP-binding protein
MENQFLMRLCSLARLEPEDQSALQSLMRYVISIEPRDIVCHAGEPAESYPVVLAGWAARSRLLSNGDRQITGLLLPGDLAYSSRHASPMANEEIVALSFCRVAFISRRALHALMAARPGIADAMQAYAAVEYAISSAWLVSLGRRNATARLAHLLCELRHRMLQLETATPNCFPLPLTQNDLADALGLTPVHINRKLQALRQDELIKLKSKNIEILDLPFLTASASFDPGYLDYAPAAAFQTVSN